MNIDKIINISTLISNLTHQYVFKPVHFVGTNQNMRHVHKESWLSILSVIISSTLAFDGHLIKSLSDVVGAENFTYYSYEDKGPAVIVLQSIKGRMPPWFYSI